MPTWPIRRLQKQRQTPSFENNPNNPVQARSTCAPCKRKALHPRLLLKRIQPRLENSFQRSSIAVQLKPGEVDSNALPGWEASTKELSNLNYKPDPECSKTFLANQLDWLKKQDVANTDQLYFTSKAALTIVVIFVHLALSALILAFILPLICNYLGSFNTKVE